MIQPLGRKLLPGIVAMAGFTLLLTGCGAKQDNGPSKEALAALSQEAKQVSIALPSFAPPEARETYALAYANRDVLAYIPCYCGCGDSGHTSNQSCFIDSVNLNGEVVWDKMGAD
jgi:hypothetical protein